MFLEIMTSVQIIYLLNPDIIQHVEVLSFSNLVESCFRYVGTRSTDKSLLLSMSSIIGTCHLRRKGAASDMNVEAMHMRLETQ